MSDAPKTTIWQYNVFARPTRMTSDEHMSRLLAEGYEGWELVSVVASDGWMTLFMKRPQPVQDQSL